MELALRPLSEAEAKGLVFDVEPKSVRLVLPRLMSFLAVRNEWAYRIITSSDDLWTEVQAAGSEVMGRHNKWLAYTLKQLFLRPSANTSAFEALVLNEAELDRQIDGKWLWKRMQQPVIALTGQEERARFDTFQGETYLVAGASTAENFANTAIMISDFKALPSIYTDQRNGILHALLHQFAKLCPTKANELQDDLAVAEAGGIRFAHTEAQLTALVVSHASRLAPFEVLAVEGGRGPGTPGERGDQGPPLRDVPCDNCGNDPDGGPPNHHPKVCKYKPMCYGSERKGIPGCPCGQRQATGKRVKGPEACVLNLAACPNGDVLKRDGTKQPSYMQAWYTNAWKKKKLGTTEEAATVQPAKEASVVEGGLLLGNHFAMSYSQGEASMLEVGGDGDDLGQLDVGIEHHHIGGGETAAPHADCLDELSCIDGESPPPSPQSREGEEADSQVSPAPMPPLQPSSGEGGMRVPPYSGAHFSALTFRHAGSARRDQSHLCCRCVCHWHRPSDVFFLLLPLVGRGRVLGHGLEPVANCAELGRLECMEANTPETCEVFRSVLLF